MVISTEEERIESHDFNDGLEEKQRKIARYLFRAAHSWSGGSPGLNTLDKLIPLTHFLDVGYGSLRDMTVEEIVSIAQMHFNTEAIQTEFSSWSSSLLLVLCIAVHYHQQGYQGVIIAVVDTYKMPAGKVAMSKDICNRPGDDVEVGGDHEALIHGIVQKAAPEYFEAVSLQDILDAGLQDMIPEFGNEIGKSDWMGGHMRRVLFEEDRVPRVVLEGETHITRLERQAQICKKLAGLWGPKFNGPMACAFLSLVEQQWWEKGMKVVDENYRELVRVQFQNLPKRKAWREYSVRPEQEIRGEWLFVEVSQMYFLLKYMCDLPEPQA